MANRKKYSTIQIRSEVKEELASFCATNGYKISGYVEKLIKSALTFSAITSSDIELKEGESVSAMLHSSASADTMRTSSRH